MNKFTIFAGIVVLVLGYIMLSGDKNEVINPNEEVTIDQATNDNGGGATIAPVSHASFVLTFGEQTIYNDPVGEVSAYEAFATPDIILVSDIHGDHLNTDTLTALAGDETTIVAPQAVADQFSATLLEKTTVMANDETKELLGIEIEAVPMYNLPEQGVEMRHVKGRGNGYILTSGNQRIYIAGDTAGIPEMRALKDISLAFVPMNLPYTMSVEEAAEAVLAFAPSEVFPYHYRTPDGFSDVAKFKELVEAGNPDIVVNDLNWYPETETEVVE